MLTLVRLTPNVADALHADPVEAMTVESLRTTTAVSGYLGLNRASRRGPFDAKVSTGTADFRASALSLSAAVGEAIRKAEAAA